MANQLKVQLFRTNDIIDDGGKQFELGKNWCEDFFNIDPSLPEYTINLKFRSISQEYMHLNDKIIELKLADVSTRGDRKAYANSDSGRSQIKDFFIDDLRLNMSNVKRDYFAVLSTQEEYLLYFVSEPLYNNFLELFKTTSTIVSVERATSSVITQSKNKQIIFYGAPGTGKSHKVNDLTREAEKEERVFRTTFHPDSDYSTFVGAYKPTKVNNRRQRRMNLSLEDLAKELGRYYNVDELGKIAGIQRFCFEYHPYINGEYMSVNVEKLVELAGISSNYVSEINKYIKFLNILPEEKSSNITYEFVPQAFTKAYVDAWNAEEDVFLIIEEINRGNCAQIFGDLFQLLDRKNGFSEYPVDADSDLKDYINTELQNSPRIDFPKGVKEGKKLVLPSNLYIWATMNTSDQSLFPIDSAFKRRWEWKYIPIKNHEDKNYKIEIGESKYDWWQFLRKINQVINVTTNSEDKKLGYFFVKTEDGKIKAEQFIGKVLFYLWNDVFKNYGFDNSIFDKEDKNKFEFSDFFDDNGNPNTNMVNRFLVKLDETIDKEHSFIETVISDTNNSQNSENAENSENTGDTENSNLE